MLASDVLGTKSLNVLINLCFAAAATVFSTNLNRIICIVTVFNVRLSHTLNSAQNDKNPMSRDRKLLYIPKSKAKPHSGIPPITQFADDFVACAWRLYYLPSVRWVKLFQLILCGCFLFNSVCDRSHIEFIPPWASTCDFDCRVAMEVPSQICDAWCRGYGVVNMVWFSSV